MKQLTRNALWIFCSALALAISGLESSALGLPSTPLVIRNEEAQIQVTGLSRTQTRNYASLSGRVIAADTGRPLRRELIRIVSADTGEASTVRTNDDGLYESGDLTPGRYVITAEATGAYLASSYGQVRPTQPPKPVHLLMDETAQHIDIAVPRGGVMSGQVLDEIGEPVPKLVVAAERDQVVQGQHRLVIARRSTTNDLGEFRIFRIPPGNYYLVVGPATADASGSDDDAYGATFLPGTTELEQARRIAIDIGQSVGGLVMSLKPTGAVRLSGTVEASDGSAYSGPLVIARLPSEGTPFVSTVLVRRDGSFRAGHLAPGRYLLRAEWAPDTNGNLGETATLTTSLGDGVNPDVHMVGSKPSVLSGRVVFDGASQPPTALVIAAAPNEDATIPSRVTATRVSTDMSFSVSARPGRTRIVLPANQRDWTIRSVRWRGVDVTDSGIDVQPDQAVSELVVDITNKLTRIDGIVGGEQGVASTECAIVAFPQDKEKWNNLARYGAVARPDQGGVFKITSLPAGDYYAIAVGLTETENAQDPASLESWSQRAERLVLQEGASVTLKLRLPEMAR